MELLIGLVIAAIVVAWVSEPVRRGASSLAERIEDPVLGELEARKQAKYREIRDAEQDHAQGKFSDEEFARQDAELRREAIAILREIDAAESAAGRARSRPPEGRFSG